jgi:putative transposase
VNEVRIVPRSNHYVLEVVYTVEVEPNPDLDDSLVAGVDIGLNNLAVLTSNKPGFQPLLINGRPLKSINQYYNKRKAELQSQLPGQRKSSRRINQLSNKRNRRVAHYLHTASRQVIDCLVEQGIGVLVIGYNQEWKQAIKLGKQNNQNFVSIPHARLVQMLTYKAQLAGIRVRLTEESYTSKCSFLDLEPIGKRESYAGKRVKRGLFRSSTGQHINADVNGSYNIIRKVVPDAFNSEGIEDVVVHPLGFQPING